MITSTKSSFIVVGLIAIILTGCGREEKKTTASSSTVPEVEVIDVKRLQPSMQIVLPGELKPWNKSPLFAKVKGYVGQVNADRGSSVKKGQILAVLEAPEVVAAYNHAKAQVSASEANLIEQRAKQRASGLTYKRIVETNQTSGAVSANELDMSYSRMMADSALATAAQQNLNAAQAQLASQAQLVSYLSVRAPFDGTITERSVSPGELVGDAKPLFTLEDRSKLRLTVAIPENLANSIEQKSTVSFSVQADPLKQYQANFARSGNTLQENNRSMIAEFDFINNNDDLKAGMYAEVKLPVTRNKSTLFVPRTSLIHSTEGVFVVKVKDNAAEWVNIQKGNSLDSLIEVFGPLQEGEKIVKQAYEELRNGQPIKTR